MIVEAPILGCEHGLQEMVGKLAQRYGRVLLQTAFADLDPVATEKGDGEVLARQEIIAGQAEGRLGEHQEPDRADGAERRRLAQKLDKSLRNPETCSLSMRSAKRR